MCEPGGLAPEAARCAEESFALLSSVRVRWVGAFSCGKATEWGGTTDRPGCGVALRGGGVDSTAPPRVLASISFMSSREKTEEQQPYIFPECAVWGRAVCAQCAGPRAVQVMCSKGSCLVKHFCSKGWSRSREASRKCGFLARPFTACGVCVLEQPWWRQSWSRMCGCP